MNDAIINIFRFGIISFVITSIHFGKTFTSIVWNVFAHPKIRKNMVVIKRAKNRNFCGGNLFEDTVNQSNS